MSDPKKVPCPICGQTTTHVHVWPPTGLFISAEERQAYEKATMQDSSEPSRSVHVRVMSDNGIVISEIGAPNGCKLDTPGEPILSATVEFETSTEDNSAVTETLQNHEDRLAELEERADTHNSALRAMDKRVGALQKGLMALTRTAFDRSLKELADFIQSRAA